MSLLVRTYALFLAATCVLPGSAALAAKPYASTTPLLGEPMGKLSVGSPASAEVTCTLGELGTPAFSFNYLLPPNDAYYTLLDPEQCVGCTGGILQLDIAHVFLSFPVLCQIPVSVAMTQVRSPSVTGTGKNFPHGPLNVSVAPSSSRCR